MAGIVSNTCETPGRLRVRVCVAGAPEAWPEADKARPLDTDRQGRGQALSPQVRRKSTSPGGVEASREQGRERSERGCECPKTKIVKGSPPRPRPWRHCVMCVLPSGVAIFYLEWACDRPRSRRRRAAGRSPRCPSRRPARTLPTRATLPARRKGTRTRHITCNGQRASHHIATRRDRATRTYLAAGRAARREPGVVGVAGAAGELVEGLPPQARLGGVGHAQRHGPRGPQPGDGRRVRGRAALLARTDRHTALEGQACHRNTVVIWRSSQRGQRSQRSACKLQGRQTRETHLWRHCLPSRRRKMWRALAARMAALRAALLADRPCQGHAQSYTKTMPAVTEVGWKWGDRTRLSDCPRRPAVLAVASRLSP